MCDSEWHFRGFSSYGFKALSLGYCAKCIGSIGAAG